MQIRGIDEIDNRIVNLLLEDGRMSYSDIAEKVGLSRTAVKTRIAALAFRSIQSPCLSFLNHTVNSRWPSILHMVV